MNFIDRMERSLATPTHARQVEALAFEAIQRDVILVPLG